MGFADDRVWPLNLNELEQPLKPRESFLTSHHKVVPKINGANVTLKKIGKIEGLQSFSFNESTSYEFFIRFRN